MMKAMLEFSLPDEQEDLDAALTGIKWRGIVSTLDEELRRRIKYADDSEDTTSVLEELRTMLREELQATGLTLE